MLFHSFDFLCFFPIVLLIYFVIPKKLRYLWLLAASYYFYMCWNIKYVLLLAGSTLITYVGALLLEYWRDWKRLKNITVAASLVLNFGILFLFKYFDFAAVTLQKILGKIGIGMQVPKLDILLPVGISFYIFQAVGYIMDVYREKIEPEKNPLRYALFVSFFPQLVAGPIERSTNLLPQLQRVHEYKLWDTKRIQRGALIMLYGYILKLIIADRAAIYVDTIFDPMMYTYYQGFQTALAAILFSVQIYCDFAGYTYIAVGAAKIMGFDLMDNFQMPYLARNIKDFWDRWHISLSGWFRDYLYFPLGGSRKGTLRKYFNIFVVFTLSGLWHGAAWHYVAWGILHGVLRIAGEVTLPWRVCLYKRLHFKRDTHATALVQVLCTFTLVTIAWIFFRGESVRQAVDMIRSIFSVFNPWILTDGSLYTLGLDTMEWDVLLAGMLFLLIVDMLRYRKVNLPEWFMQQNLWFRWIVFYIGILVVVLFGVYGAQYNAAAFIYFQF